MADSILGTTEITFEIESLLKDASDYLVIVSPYLRINQRLKVKLSDSFKKTDKVFILYRKGQADLNEVRWVESFHNVTAYAITNLHAKVYFNQRVTIISSMNLYEYSQVNNHEIGYKFHSQGRSFDALLEEIRIMIESEYDSTDFINLTLNTSDYTMGTLCGNLTNHHKVTKPERIWLNQYEWLCEKASELVTFNEEELYKDKSAVLRNTDLGKERYELLERELKKLGNSHR